MHQLEILKMLLQERKESYERLLACCVDMVLACRLEELNELIQIVDVRLEKLRKTENTCSRSRG